MIERLEDGVWRLEPDGGPLRGEWQPPGDRNLTHLALILGSLAISPVRIQGALECSDTVSTRRVLVHLGVSFTTDEEGWLVVSRNESALTRPEVELDCAHSATCLRLMIGLLSGQRFNSMLTADDELWGLPLTALLSPLRKMGAQIECLGGVGKLPLRIKGQPLYPLDVALDPAAAEMHDPIMLAALYSVGESRITEAAPGPDHLERLLRHLGVSVRHLGLTTTLKGEQRIYPRRVKIPGDFSAAAPLIVAATLLPDSELFINEVGTNPGRSGLLRTLARAGACVERQRTWQFGGEPVSSFIVHHAPRLLAFTVAPNLAPSLLDEIPLLALLASQASGVSVINGAHALSSGHPDLLLLAAQMLQNFGADVEYSSDGLRITGPARLTGAEVQCASDPRLALLAITAALIADGASVLHGAECVHEYYPGFYAALRRLTVLDPAGFAEESA